MRLLLILLFFIAHSAQAAMDATSCETKIKAAIQAGTGSTVQSPNVLKYICEGIIEELKTNAELNGVCNVSGGSSSGSHPTTGGLL